MPVRDVRHSQVVHLCGRHHLPYMRYHASAKTAPRVGPGQLAWRGEAGGEGRPKGSCSPHRRRTGASAARSADTTVPRGRVRGKPASASSAIPDPAPALVRRRPRRTSRRAKRPSPQPCRRRGSADDGQDPRRRRAECFVAIAPRNGVAQPAPRSRACEKAAAFDAVYLDTSEMASDGGS